MIYFIFNTGERIKMEIHYIPQGVCSKQIDIVLENDIIREIYRWVQRQYPGGRCSGTRNEGTGVH